MFDMSWGEIMVIGGVALIVIGPKDLPKALRTVGQVTAKMRRMAGEFQSQFNEAMREAELEDVKKEVAGLNQSVASATSAAFNPIQTIRDEIRGAVDSKPVPTTPEADIWGTNPGPVSADVAAGTPASASGQPVEEVGPVPRIEPAGEPQPVDPGLFGEAQPLRPVPEPPAVVPEEPGRRPGPETAPAAAPREPESRT